MTPSERKVTQADSIINFNRREMVGLSSRVTGGSTTLCESAAM